MHLQLVETSLSKQVRWLSDAVFDMQANFVTPELRVRGQDVSSEHELFFVLLPPLDNIVSQSAAATTIDES